MFDGSQYNNLLSFPITHPSLFAAFQTLPFESTSTYHIRIDPFSSADANLMYWFSDEGRNTTEATRDGTFALNKSSPVDVFHTQALLPRDPEAKYASSGEKQTEITYSCASIGSRTGLPSLASQTRIVPSKDPDRMYKPLKFGIC